MVSLDWVSIVRVDPVPDGPPRLLFRDEALARFGIDRQDITREFQELSSSAASSLAEWSI